MNDYDKYLKRKAAAEQTELPPAVRYRMEQVLSDLPERKPASKGLPLLARAAAAVVCCLLLMIVVLPNVSVAYAQALEQIPVIGDIIRVVTIRNYTYSDDYHEIEVEVPEIVETNPAAEQINQDITQLTDTLVEEFYKEVELVGDEGHGSLYVDYETVTNTDTWFTLKLQVHRDAGSGSTYYLFYHIDKRTNEIVQLDDLAKDDSFYDVLVQEIKRQMQMQMENDSKVTYWLDDSIIGEDFVSVTKDHNFYWNENNDLVIIFDKYEVAPGSMGTPEFAISKDVLKDVMKEEYADMP